MRWRTSSLSGANAKGIAPEDQHGRQGEHRHDHRDQSGGRLGVEPGEHDIESGGDHEQQRNHDRERHSDRQHRQSTGLQLEPHLRPRRRRGGTREPEQAGEPVRESSPFDGPWDGCPCIAATLPRHTGDRETERHDSNQDHQCVLGEGQLDLQWRRQAISEQRDHRQGNGRCAKSTGRLCFGSNTGCRYKQSGRPRGTRSRRTTGTAGRKRIPGEPRMRRTTPHT